jgi:hypothetical protein
VPMACRSWGAGAGRVGDPGGLPSGRAPAGLLPLAPRCVVPTNEQALYPQGRLIGFPGPRANCAVRRLGIPHGLMTQSQARLQDRRRGLSRR